MCGWGGGGGGITAGEAAVDAPVGRLCHARVADKSNSVAAGKAIVTNTVVYPSQKIVPAHRSANPLPYYDVTIYNIIRGIYKVK